MRFKALLILMLLAAFTLWISSTPQASSQTGNLPETINLDASDQRLINDFFGELLRLAISTKFAQEDIDATIKRVQVIQKRYCRCNDADFKDWAEGKGLPSIVNRMNQIELSRKDAVEAQRLFDEIDDCKAIIKANDAVIESTTGLFKSRIRLSFLRASKLQEAYIGLYKLDIKNLKFVRLSSGGQPVSIDQAINIYFGDYIAALTAKVEEETEKTRQKIKARGQKPPRKKP